MKQKLIKSITLLLFTGLIAVFVFYRSDKARENKPEVQEESAEIKKKVDSISHPEAENRPEAIAPKRDIVSPKQKIKLPETKMATTKDSIDKNMKFIIPSSKSLIISEPYTPLDSFWFKK